MKAFGRFMRSAVEATAVLAAVWFGAFGGVEWAGNLLRFYVWAMAVVMLGLFVLVVIVIGLDKEGELKPLPPNALPRWVSWCVFLAVVGGLAAAGWFWTAFGYLVVCIEVVGVRAMVNAAVEKNATPSPSVTT